MGLNTNIVGEPSLLSYKLLKYIVSLHPLFPTLCPLHPSPPLFPTLLYIPKSLPISWVQETRKLSVVLFLECFASKTNFLQSSQWVIKVLPVQCNAMRLVSKEENLKRQNYPKIHLTLPNSVQHPTSHPSTNLRHHPIFPLPLLCHLQ